MLSFLFPKKTDNNIPQTLYASVVDQSRLPVFFTHFGFPDEVMGRYDLLSLNLFLLSHRLGEEGEPKAISLAQEVFDCFTEGVDDALRVLGIGDTSVPKKKKKMVRSFYGQIEDFRNPLLEGDHETLAAKVADRFFKSDSQANAETLTRYMLRLNEHLSTQSLEAFYNGQISWIDPSTVLKNEN